jgi:hypothetical protein
VFNISRGHKPKHLHILLDEAKERGGSKSSLDTNEVTKKGLCVFLTKGIELVNDNSDKFCCATRFSKMSQFCDSGDSALLFFPRLAIDHDNLLHQPII